MSLDKCCQLEGSREWCEPVFYNTGKFMYVCSQLWELSNWFVCVEEAYRPFMCTIYMLTISPGWKLINFMCMVLCVCMIFARWRFEDWNIVLIRWVCVLDSLVFSDPSHLSLRPDGWRLNVFASAVNASFNDCRCYRFINHTLCLLSHFCCRRLCLCCWLERKQLQPR